MHFIPHGRCDDVVVNLSLVWYVITGLSAVWYYNSKGGQCTSFSAGGFCDRQIQC